LKERRARYKKKLKKLESNEN